MKKIYWAVPGALESPELEILYFEPEPAYKFLLEKKQGANYIKCPAIPAYLKNTFILRSPMDVNLWVDEAGELRTDSCDQAFYDKNFWCRTGQHGEMIVQLLPCVLFFTDDDQGVLLEHLPPILHEVSNALFIPGSFDISKWVRPLNYGFEIADRTKPIQIKRGDPLYMVKFICEHDDTVQLERTIMDAQLEQVVNAHTQLKQVAPKTNLKTLYAMASDYLKVARKKIFKR